MKQQKLVTAVVATASMVAFSGSALADVLLDNGPLVTNPGGGFDGADASALQGDQTILGVANDVTNDFRLSDDFAVSDPDGWTVDTITFFAYQTGSTTTSTMTAVNLRIWDGPPGEPGSTVVFGDTSTNRLESTAWSGIYRTAAGTPLADNRPIMASVVTVGTLLPQGAYWLDWQTDGTLASGPWAPPITVVGATTTGNATQSGDGMTYAPVTDDGSGTALGMPFIIEGTGQSAACEGDTNSDGQVNVTDLVNVITTWGTDGQGDGFNADVNGDGIVDVTDLVNGVITNWGPCAGALRACCTEVGGCNEIAELDCAISGGIIQAPLSSCTEGVLCTDLTGACCFPETGTCQTLLPSECAEADGVHQGEGSSCASGICDPDSNDTCAGAIALSFGEAVMGSTVNSTADDDAEAIGCVDDNNNPVTSPGNWYSVVGNGSTLTATMCDSPNPYDAKLYVYCAPKGCNGFFCLTADDDGCGIVGGPAEVEWCSEDGEDYLILVTGFADSVGEYQLVVNAGGACGEPTPCQDNDSVCSFATDLEIGGSILGYDTCEGITAATAPACPTSGQTAEGRWVRVVGDGTTLTVSLCNPEPIGFNSRLNVYCGPCDNLECAAAETSNNSGCAPFTEQISWCSQDGADYYILVSGSNECGVVDVTVTSDETPCDDPPCQPLFGDECATPIVLELALGETTTDSRFLSEGFTTDDANDPDPEFCAGGINAYTKDASWWYEVTIPEGTSSVLISACSTDADFDNVLGIYASCGDLEEVDCDDDTCTAPAFGPFELLTTALTPGETYLLYVDVYSPNSGDGPYTIEITPNP